MKKIISIAFLICTLFLGNALGQQISAEAYNKEVIHEDFNQVTDIFKIVTTTDNYFILDNGDYLLSRNNSESEYAIIAKNSSVSDFVLKTAIRIGPSNNKRASIGIILKAQRDGKGAIIFELNKKGQYRIKQLQGNTYSTLSGNKKNNGWVKSKTVNGVDEHNFVEIRSENNIYDVYINNKYLTSFFIPDYTTGACGLIISSATKARISYYYISSKGESLVAASYVNENTIDQSDLVENLNKKIKILEENNRQLNELHSEVRSNQEQVTGNLNLAHAILKDKIKAKEKEITDLNNTIVELNNNTQFEELEEKYNIALNQVNELNTELEEEKSKNEVLKSNESNLETENDKLKDIKKQQEEEIKSLNISNTDLTNSNTSANTKTKQLNKQIASIKQQLSTEQAINAELTKDLNTSSSENTSISTKLNKTISSLNTKIDALEKEKNNLSSKLSLEINSHTKTKNGLSKSVTKKAGEIKELARQLTKINKELSSLRKLQAEHNAITSNLENKNTTLNSTIDDLNNQLTSLKEELSELKTTNTDLKDLFILKDFEVNGVKPSELTKITTTYPSPEELIGNEKIYAVQFGVYMTIQSYDSLKGLDEVWYETTKHGTYVYLSGQFKSPKEATAHKNTLITLGYPNAFVVTLTK